MSTKTVNNKKVTYPPSQYGRDEFGLLHGYDHVFKEDGSVDWKAMIPSQYIVVNEELVSQEGKEIPKDLNDLEDYQKLILLGGIKEVAKIRGLIKRSTKVDYTSDYKAVVTTEVTFIPNYESFSQFLVYADTASATSENAGGIGRYYLETIASNRSFVRAVRNALRIDIVGSDEVNMAYSGGGFQSNSESDIMSAGSKPIDMLIEKAGIKGYSTFDSFKERLVSAGGFKDIPLETVNAWSDWKDIEPESVWILLRALNSAKTSKK